MGLAGGLSADLSPAPLRLDLLAKLLQRRLVVIDVLAPIQLIEPNLHFAAQAIGCRSTLLKQAQRLANHLAFGLELAAGNGVFHKLLMFRRNIDGHVLFSSRPCHILYPAVSITQLTSPHGQSAAKEIVGWVERSEPHQNPRKAHGGARGLDPPYKTHMPTQASGMAPAPPSR